jgi:hypothetical protein
MAVKKESASATPRKSTRSAKVKPAADFSDRQMPETASTAQLAAGSARNAVITGNSSIDTDDVRRRAYELYEARGRQDGFHEEDWHRAERELRARQQNETQANVQTIPPRKKSA